QLQDGWNLISLPLVPTDDDEVENTSIDYILSGLSGGSVERILTYDASTKLWKEYDPIGTKTLTDMITGIGYFLKMKGSATLTIKGVEIYNNMPRSYEVVEGWNLIGYTSTHEIPVEIALNGIDGKYSSLWMLDNGKWKSYIANDFWSMQPGKGYWIYMNSKGVIDYKYAELQNELDATKRELESTRSERDSYKSQLDEANKKIEGLNQDLMDLLSECGSSGNTTQ
ncbi:MAG: hypothetical protein ACE5KE_07535, partial [Methanosarcinales archaeon]